MILIRRVVHRRLAILNLVYAVVNTIVAVFLAWRGFTLLALLATDLIALLLNVFSMYIWKPFWRPRLLWDWSRIQYYLRFGSRNIAASLLLQASNEVDDIWTGRALGNTALGFYSRVYTFASYPRMIIAQPMEAVSAGTYAELKGDRKRLSMAFFRFNALIVRINFLFAGGLFLVAYEFVLLVLGERWLPMTVPFQLMLIFTMLDPIKLTLGNLLTVIGYPEKVVRVRLVQFGVLITGLFLLAPTLNIIGVTLAVDLMLMCGIVLLFIQVKEYVDFSLPRLFGAPALSLMAGLLAAGLAARWPGLPESLWVLAILKGAVFSLAYGLVLFLLERQSILEMIKFALSAGKRPAAVTKDEV
jgi:O-antigen/teichoic acid export membrane protein